MTNFMNNYLKLYDLSLSEWKVLGSLYERGELTPSDIGEMLGIKLPIATRLINHMEAKKLLKRSSGQPDKRKIEVQISPSGKRLAKQLEHSLRHEMRQFLGDISHKELETYLLVLNKLAAKL